MRKICHFGIAAIVSITFFFVYCDHIIGPDPLDFSQMEIHYSITGGWINKSELDIYGDGSIKAYLIAHSGETVLDSAAALLSPEEQTNIANKFVIFSIYDNYYQPSEIPTDQDTHRIIMIYQGEPDTVSVYMPDQADMPQSLRDITEYLDGLFGSTINSYVK